MLESLNLTHPLIIEDGLLAAGAKALGRTQDELVAQLMNNSISVPAVINSRSLLLRSIPGHTIAGTYGPKKSDVMLVGNHPYPEELRNRRLFSQNIGNVFRQPLAKLNIDYNSWFVANVCSFHIPDGVKFNKGLIKEFRGILEATYKLVQPKFILLFGADALKSFWALKDPAASVKMKLKDYRGAILDFNANTKVMVTYHPSNVIVDPSIKLEFERDIEAFAALIASSNKSNRNDKIQEIDNADDLNKFVDKLIADGHTRFALDCEWGGGSWRNGQIRTIQVAWSKSEAAVIILRRCGMVPAFKPSAESVIPILTRLFKRPGVNVVGHNLRGDIKWLQQMGLDLLPEFVNGGFDTMLGHHMLYETADQQLELVGLKLLNTPRYDLPLRIWLPKNGIDKKVVKKQGYSMVPDDILHPYAGMDAIVSFELDEYLRKELSKVPKLNDLYFKVVHPANVPILEMETGGINVDVARFKDMIELFKTKQEELKAELQKKTKWPDFNPRSVDNVREVLFGWFKEKDGQIVKKSPEDAVILKLRPVKATDNTPWERIDLAAEDDPDVYKRFNPSTDAESLSILASDDELAKDIKQFKVIDQVVKNFLRPGEEDEDTGEIEWTGGIGSVIDDDDRLRTNFRQTLETGRYASSPNCQNYPSKQEAELKSIFTANGVTNPRYHPIKSIFVASPGTVLMEADWASAELYTIAALAKEEVMLHALRTTDLHTTTLRQMFSTKIYNGKKICEYEVAELNELRKHDIELKKLRTIGKGIAFGLIYGRGGTAIAREVKKEGVILSAAEANEAIQTYFNNYPKVASFINLCKTQVLNQGYLISPWGRYRRFPHSDDKMIQSGYQREGTNFMVQGTVADAMSKALINLWEYRLAQQGKVQFRILLSIHDAILLEVPIPYIEPVIEEVLPLCMCKNVEIPGLGLQYTLGEIDVQLRWGQHADPAELASMGVPQKYCK